LPRGCVFARDTPRNCVHLRTLGAREGAENAHNLRRVGVQTRTLGDCQLVALLV